MLVNTSDMLKRLLNLEKMVYGPYLDVVFSIENNLAADTILDVQTPGSGYTVAAPGPGFRNFMDTKNEFNRNAKLQVFLDGIPQTKDHAFVWVSPTQIKCTGPLYRGQKVKLWYTPLSEDIHITGVGPSAYEIAIQNGFVGTEQQWLDSLGSGIELLDEGISLGSNTINTINITGGNFEATLDSPTEATIAITVPPIPFAITNFTNNRSVLEKGESVGPTGTYSNMTFNWVYSRDPDTSQSINNSVGAVAPVSLRTKLHNPLSNINTDTTFTLTAVDAMTNYTANTGVNFQSKRYWGTSASSDPSGVATYTNLASFLDTVNQEFATTRQTTKIFDCSAGRYWYFFFPNSWGTASPEVMIGPFPVILAYSNTLSFTNFSGHTETYRIYRSDNLIFDNPVSVQIL